MSVEVYERERATLRTAALAAGIRRCYATSARSFALLLLDGLRRVEFRYFRYAPTFHVEAYNHFDVAVTVEWRLSDRNTGEELRAANTRVNFIYPLEPEEVVELARTLVREFVLHEVDECLRLGDARPFDPHVDERVEKVA